jgi:hypothetical protein
MRQTAVSDFHCGAGCVIGDIISEFSLFALASLANRCMQSTPATYYSPGYLGSRFNTSR